MKSKSIVKQITRSFRQIINQLEVITFSSTAIVHPSVHPSISWLTSHSRSSEEWLAKWDLRCLSGFADSSTALLDWLTADRSIDRVVIGGDGNFCVPNLTYFNHVLVTICVWLYCTGRIRCNLNTHVLCLWSLYSPSAAVHVLLLLELTERRLTDGMLPRSLPGIVLPDDRSTNVS